jgi:hypothetical protein
MAVMEALHAKLAGAFTEILMGEPTAAELNVIRQFLKDNNIDAIPTKGSPLGSLRDKLPFPSADGIEAEEARMH